MGPSLLHHAALPVLSATVDGFVSILHVIADDLVVVYNACAVGIILGCGIFMVGFIIVIKKGVHQR